MEATLREMGVTYGLPQGDQAAPWMCDLLPHVFTATEWQQVTAGVTQRIRAFELFLQDMYGKRQILRDGSSPCRPVLGSPHYEAASIGLPLPERRLPAPERRLPYAQRQRPPGREGAPHEPRLRHLLHDPEPARAGQCAAGFVRGKRRQFPGGYPLAGGRGAAEPRRADLGRALGGPALPGDGEPAITPSTASSRGAWASRWSRVATSWCWTIMCT